MTLKIWTPERLFPETKTSKIVAEGSNGYFCLLPNHIDFLSDLIPGVLSYSKGEEEYYWAVSRGTLVKCREEVMISVRNAIRGENLEDLELIVRSRFRDVDQKEGEIGMAMKQLEADFLRRFIELTDREI